jgi:hypothetical protein
MNSVVDPSMRARIRGDGCSAFQGEREARAKHAWIAGTARDIFLDLTPLPPGHG